MMTKNRRIWNDERPKELLKPSRIWIDFAAWQWHLSNMFSSSERGLEEKENAPFALDSEYQKEKKEDKGY